MMAGRKRKIGAREPNGKLQRAPRPQRREDERQVVRDARARQFAVSQTTAASMLETSWLAAQEAKGAIDRHQYNAAVQYAGIVEDRRRMLQVPGFPEAANLDRGGGYGSEFETDGYIQWTRRTQENIIRCERALNGTWLGSVHAKAVTKAVVLDGYAMPHRLDELRIGLNALAKVLAT